MGLDCEQPVVTLAEASSRQVEVRSWVRARVQDGVRVMCHLGRSKDRQTVAHVHAVDLPHELARQRLSLLEGLEVLVGVRVKGEGLGLGWDREGWA